jgi:hypothetical protein
MLPFTLDDTTLHDLCKKRFIKQFQKTLLINYNRSQVSGVVMKFTPVCGQKYPEDGDNMFLQNTGNHPHDYTASQPRRPMIHIFTALETSKSLFPEF